MRHALTLLAPLMLGACISTVADTPLTPPDPGALALRGELQARVAVDRERHQIDLFAGPFDIPSGTAAGHDHQHGEGDDARSPLIPFVWPVDGGLQGVRMALYGSDGTAYPRGILHHMIGVNFARRQLVYPVIERTFGFGAETQDVTLPDFLQIPVERGDSLGVWVMWNNTTGHDLEGVIVRLTLQYAPPGRDREAVFPIYMDTHNEIGVGTSFDVPPGRSTWSHEFELPVAGSLLASSGHLHDYGRELRLEEAETGRVLFTLEPERDADGHVTSVERKIFRRFFKLLDARIPLREGVRYRVVGVYDNPTGQTLHDGGMAHIVGLFAPESVDRWPELDTSLPAYRTDRAHLPRRLGGSR